MIFVTRNAQSIHLQSSTASIVLLIIKDIWVVWSALHKQNKQLIALQAMRCKNQLPFSNSTKESISRSWVLMLNRQVSVPYNWKCGPIQSQWTLWSPSWAASKCQLSAPWSLVDVAHLLIRSVLKVAMASTFLHTGPQTWPWACMQGRERRHCLH